MMSSKSFPSGNMDDRGQVGEGRGVKERTNTGCGHWQKLQSCVVSQIVDLHIYCENTVLLSHFACSLRKSPDTSIKQPHRIQLHRHSNPNSCIWCCLLAHFSPRQWGSCVCRCPVAEDHFSHARCDCFSVSAFITVLDRIGNKCDQLKAICSHKKSSTHVIVFEYEKLNTVFTCAAVIQYENSYI